MNKIDELLSSLKDDILNEDCVKQYFYYKNIIENDESIKALDKEMKFHQKEMCKNSKNSDVYLKEKRIFEDLKKKFDSNPVLINYQIAKEEVLSLLVDIKTLLS